MDARIGEYAKWLASDYPMKPDNPLLRATDEEIRAYIRRRVEEFKPKLEAYLARRRAEYAKTRGEKGIPE